MPGGSRDVCEPLRQPSHIRLADVGDHQAQVEPGVGHVRCAEVPSRGLGAIAAVTRDVETRRQPTGASRQTQTIGVTSLAIVQHVALIAERQPTRIEARVNLPQPALCAGICDGDFHVGRRFALHAEPSRIDPDGASVADIGGKEVGGGAVGEHLLGGQACGA